MLRSFFTDETGATAIEYGLIAAVVAAAIITGTVTLGNNLVTSFDYVATSVGSTAP